MAEYKDCEALIKHLREIYCSECNNYNGVRCRACEVGDVIDMIDDAPTADVAPVIHAIWKIKIGTEQPGDFTAGEHDTFYCSHCGLSGNPFDKYCKECGAKMRR